MYMQCTLKYYLVPYFLSDLQNKRFHRIKLYFIFPLPGLDKTEMLQRRLSSTMIERLARNLGKSFVLVGMTEVMPDRCTVLAKRELLFFGPFGLAAWLSGLVFVDRLNREKARKTMDMIAKLMHDKKVCELVIHNYFFQIITFWGFF